MFKVFILSVFLIGAIFCQAQSKTAIKFITIKGEVESLIPDEVIMGSAGYNINKVYLGHRDGTDFKIADSATVNKNGNWQLKVPVTKPMFYEIEILKSDRITVWTDADMSIKSRGYDSAKIKKPQYIFIESTGDNNFINIVNNAAFLYGQQLTESGLEQRTANSSKDSAWTNYLKNTNPARQISNDYIDRVKVLVRSYKNKPVVLYGIKRLNWTRENDFIWPIVQDIKTKYPWFKEMAAYQKQAEDNIARIQAIQPGKPFPVVAYNNPENKPISIKDYKGKLVLVDFWASWCGPCRKAIPRVNEVFEKYKKKGFEVLSISIDKDEKAWRKAVGEEAMPWAQTLSPDMNITMSLYNFSIIPSLFLVDRDGKIVKQYAGFTDQVEAKIKEMID